MKHVLFWLLQKKMDRISLKVFLCLKTTESYDIEVEMIGNHYSNTILTRRIDLVKKYSSLCNFYYF